MKYCDDSIRHTSISRCALTESSSRLPTARLSPALRTWLRMNENSIATVLTSTRSASLMYVSTEIPSSPMITAAMPPSMLSTTFLSVSANKFHLSEHGTRAARVGLGVVPANHMTVAGQTRPVADVQQSTMPSCAKLQA